MSLLNLINIYTPLYADKVHLMRITLTVDPKL